MLSLWQSPPTKSLLLSRRATPSRRSARLKRSCCRWTPDGSWPGSSRCRRSSNHWPLPPMARCWRSGRGMACCGFTPFRVESCFRSFQNERGAISGVKFSADGQYLAIGILGNDEVADRSCTIEIWDTKKNAAVDVLPVPGKAPQAVWSPRETVLAIDTGSAIKLWDVVGRKERQTLRTTPTSAKGDAHSMTVTCLAVAPDGKTLATGSFDRTVKLWDLPPDGSVAPGAKPRLTLPALSNVVTSVAYSPDGKTLAIGTGGHYTASGGTVSNPSGDVVMGPGGKFFYEPGAVVLWDVLAEKVRARSLCARLCRRAGVLLGRQDLGRGRKPSIPFATTAQSDLGD